MGPYMHGLPFLLSVVGTGPTSKGDLLAVGSIVFVWALELAED